MNVWAVMLLGGLLTFSMRLSFIYLLGRFEMPDALRHALRFVPPAVLSAIVFPALFMPSGRFEIGPTNPRLLAGIAAVLVAWRTRNTLLTILAGMAALLILQFVF